MSLENYYEKFYMQNWISKPDGFGGVTWGWADGAEFMGQYIQDSSAEMRIAEAQGITSSGRFITGINMQIEEKDIIRRARDNLYLRITAIPIESPDPATSKFKTMNAEKTVAPA